jgi:tetratricopeptide (TPR) repeat protein
MKIKRIPIWFILSASVFFASCGPSRVDLDDRSTQTAVALDDQTGLSAELKAATRTQAHLDYLASKPTATPRASVTPSPTLENTIAINLSPMPSSRCPDLDPDVMPPDFEAIQYEDPFHDFEADYLEYFNNSGTVSNLPAKWRPDFQLDLTNDGVDELVVERIEFMVFGCVDGEYVILFSLPATAYLSSLIFIEARDANMNGTPEFIVVVDMATQGGTSLNVFEWNGQDFVSLIDPNSPYACEDGNTWDLCGPKAHFVDFNQDGSLDFVIEGQIWVWSTYRDYLPWRTETHVYSWDGNMYAFSRRVLGPPQYRFQAVHDGDYAASLGEYDEALALFQQAILSDEPEWWSPERRTNEQEIWDAEMSGQPTPTLPAPDPDEYAYLAAYSRYRIMQLHILRGWLDEAQFVLANLQEFYPPGEPGSEFTHLAEIFMNEYLPSSSMPDACMQVIEEAGRFEERILFYLGNYHHGLQNGDYQLEDVCPY